MEGIGPDEIEIGWAVAEDRRNNGVATEAARSIVADVFDRAVATHVVAMIRLDNAPSRRVAEKIGMRLRGPGQMRNGSPAEVWELRR